MHQASLAYSKIGTKTTKSVATNKLDVKKSSPVIPNYVYNPNTRTVTISNSPNTEYTYDPDTRKVTKH